jgi:hypothetical protein
MTAEELVSPVSRRVFRALLIPADAGSPLGVVMVRDSTVAISDLLGGGLVDDPPLIGFHGTDRYALYLDINRAGAPDNPRAALLAALLGMHQRAVRAALRGAVLVTGMRPDVDEDVDVPAEVVDLVTSGPDW